jgi:hypothetical protein
MNLDIYNYTPFPSQYDAYQQRNQIHAAYRPQSDLVYAKYDPTMDVLKHDYGPQINYDHLNNPYDRLVNPNYLMPYCKPYYSPLEPNDQYGPPINTISLGIKKL